MATNTALDGSGSGLIQQPAGTSSAGHLDMVISSMTVLAIGPTTDIDGNQQSRVSLGMRPMLVRKPKTLFDRFSLQSHGLVLFRDHKPYGFENAGAIFIGETNTPKFGLGSHTYNPVYGATRNA